MRYKLNRKVISQKEKEPTKILTFEILGELITSPPPPPA